jgi:hypothetical protein
MRDDVERSGSGVIFFKLGRLMARMVDVTVDKIYSKGLKKILENIYA